MDSKRIFNSPCNTSSDDEYCDYNSYAVANPIVHKKNMGKWKKCLGVIIATANRPSTIESYLFQCAQEFYNAGVDLIFYDSSADSQTCEIVERYANIYENVKYFSWDSDPTKIVDEKVIDIYDKFSTEYDYVWVHRDGWVININNVLDCIGDKLQDGYDLIILDEESRDYKNVANKDYTDSSMLFLDQCQHLSTLGTSILKSEHIKLMLEENPLDEEKNARIWQPIAILSYFANRPVRAISRKGNFWQGTYGKVGSSHWHKKTLWLWAERWYKSITAMPTVYDAYKPQVLQIELADCKPFSIPFLINVKKLGGLQYSEVRKYKDTIPLVGKTPLWQIYALSLLPNFIARLLKKWYKFEAKTMYQPALSKKFKNKNVEIAEEISRKNFKSIENIKSHLLYVQENLPQAPYITICIPTNGMTKHLKITLDSVFNQKEVDFEWDILVIDDEPYKGSINKTEQLIRSYGSNKISYYRNEQSMNIANSYNRAFELAKAPWLMLLNENEILLPIALEKMSKSISLLSNTKAKKLAGISTFSVQYASTSNSVLDEKYIANTYWTSKAKAMKTDFSSVTIRNILFKANLCTHPIGNGTTLNREAFLSSTGFNDRFTSNFGEILFYCLLGKYSLYISPEPYAISYRDEKYESLESLHNIIADRFYFREYFLSQSFLNRFWASFFRASLYKFETSHILKAVGKYNNQTMAELASIYNVQASKLTYFLWKNLFQKVYIFKASIEKQIFKRKIKKIF